MDLSSGGVITGLNEMKSNNKNSSCVEETPRFREWAKLESFLSRIPKRYQHGFIPKDLLLTCLACSCDSLVAGSNSGLIFWYNRSSQSVTRCRIDENFTAVTSVALTISQFGEALAVGNSQGTVAIFCSNVPRHKPVFVLYKAHIFAVTAMAWDSNGERLLTGDDRGRILLSAFSNNQLQPQAKLLNESTAIVQLRFHPLLANCVLASTYFRTVVIFFDKVVEAVAAGEESRKVLLPYGADFGHLDNDLVIFLSQPGLNLLAVDLQCNTLQSFPFAGEVAKSLPRTILLTDVEECWNLKLHFGPVLCLSNNLVVTYSPAGLLVLDPAENAVVSCCRFKMSLRQAAVFHDEIFILVESRTVIRLSQRPDRFSTTSVERPLINTLRPTKDFLLKNPVPTLQSAFNKLANKVSDLELHNIKSKSIAGLNQGPLLLESLSIALGPIFGSKGKEGQEIRRGRDPLTPQTTPTSPSSSTSLAASPRENDLATSNNAINETENFIPFTPPYSESGSSAASPDPFEDRDEIVYATLREGRQMKLNQKKNSQLLNAISENKSPTGEKYADKNKVDPESLREELERKERLLAELLNLDEILGSSGQQDPVPSIEATSENITPENDEEWAGDQILLHEDSHSIPKETSRLKPTVENALDDNDDENEDDDFYSKYHTDALMTPSSICDVVSLDFATEDSKLSTTEPKSPSWLRYPMPCRNSLLNFAVCDNYIYCVEKNKVSFARFKDHSLSWNFTDFEVDYLAVSCSGRYLWKLFQGTAYCGTEVNDSFPCAEDWVPVADKILAVALDEPSFRSWGRDDPRAWLVHVDGSLTCRSASNPTGSRTVETPSAVREVAAYKGVLWILAQDGSVYARSGVSSDSPFGQKWIKVNTPPGSVHSIVLSRETAWTVIDSSVYFMNCVTMESPAGNSNWWKVVSPTKTVTPRGSRWQQMGALLNPALWLGPEKTAPFHIAVLEKKVWISVPGEDVIVSAENVAGHLWEKLELQLTSAPPSWKSINASGMYHDFGVLWLLGTNDVFYGYHKGVANQISLPCEDAFHVAAAAPGCLWILTDQGRIFIRAGIETDCPLGTGWTELSTAQFTGGSSLVSVSLGSDAAWACDAQGIAYMRTGSNDSPDLPDLCPAWIPVDDDPATPRFVKIYTCSNNFMVWAIDENNCVHARQGIYPDLPIGVSWVKIEGVAAHHLALSESSVWALAVDGEIYRRIGVTRGNLVGDRWEKITGNASSLSVSVDDTLFTVSDHPGSGECISRLLTSTPMQSRNDLDEFLARAYDAEEDWVII